MTPVVIMSLRGRLGNQLFNFATGYACAMRTGSRLAFFDQPHTGRDSYALAAVVGERFELASPRDLARLGVYDFPGPLRATLQGLSSRSAAWRASRSSHPRVIDETSVEPGEPLREALLAVRPPVILNGYFQSETYFADYAAEICDALMLPAAGKLLDGLERPLVSLTFRRGDYVDRGWELPLDYYTTALRYAARHFAPKTLLVFSDDPGYAELAAPRLAEYASVTLTPQLTRDPYMQLSLMAACDHHIIANSTFCWWGAWLCEQRSRGECSIVVPAGWVGDGAQRIPDRWIELAPEGTPPGSWLAGG